MVILAYQETYYTECTKSSRVSYGLKQHTRNNEIHSVEVDGKQ